MICDAMGKIARIAIIIVIGLMVLRVLNFSITSLLAFGGVAGIAIGFAAQGVVSNLFGALVIYLDRPFKVGEWIVLPSLNIYGTVEHIGWRATTMRGFDTRPYYVTNQIFNTSVVQTPPRMLARRIYETISIRYTDFASLEAIVDECRRFVAQNPEIDHRQSEMIYFTKFGAHALEIMVYCFANTQNWQESLRIQERLLIDLGKIIRRHGAEIAMPVSQVEISANVSRPAGPEGGDIAAMECAAAKGAAVHR
jgi:MscS family membrane protein